MSDKLIGIAIGVLITLLATAYGIEHAFAVGYFETTGFRQIHDPTICAIEPAADPSFSLVGKKMLSETFYAVIDWQNKLNENLGKNPLWKMNLVNVPLTSQKNYNYSNCDITISFKSKPQAIPSNGELIGLTTLYGNHTAKIEIYYQQIVYNVQTTTTQDAKFIYTTYTYYPSYGNFLATDPQIKMALRHELGHAFGLGHYIISDTEMQRWEQGLDESLPSIMVKVVVPIGSNHFDITPIDVEELKILYQNEGFGTPQNSTKVETGPAIEKDNFKLWLAEEPNNLDLYGDLLHLTYGNYIKLPSGYTYNGHVQMPYWFKGNIEWWVDGKISDYDFFSSLQYLIDMGMLKL